MRARLRFQFELAVREAICEKSYLADPAMQLLYELEWLSQKHIQKLDEIAELLVRNAQRAVIGQNSTVHEGNCN